MTRRASVVRVVLASAGMIEAGNDKDDGKAWIERRRVEEKIVRSNSDNIVGDVLKFCVLSDLS